MVTKKVPIVVAYGDGIGPEIMTAVLKIVKAANAAIAPEVIEIGEKVYLEGKSSGIKEEDLALIKKIGVFLKAPITSPKRDSYKSLSFTMRKTLGLQTNICTYRSLSPYVPTHYPDTDLVIVREIGEDVYVGIEHRQTKDAYQCLKLISRSNSEKVIRHAFENAKKFSRKKVTCLVKDHIMPMTDGLFHQVFNEIAMGYPDIEHDFYFMDVGAGLVVNNPEQFDILVTENLYGDIMSDIALKIVGSINIEGCANFGDDVAMFEARHGSAPDIAGQQIANPSGLLRAAIRMLVHIGQCEVAAKIENAWLKTIEDGYHTPDMYRPDYSEKKVTTNEFAEEIINRFGQQPIKFKIADYQEYKKKPIKKNKKLENNIPEELKKPTTEDKQLVGVDVFIDLPLCGPTALAECLSKLNSELSLLIIANRGISVWSNGHLLSEKCTADHWMCRFQGSKEFKKPITHNDIIHLLQSIDNAGFDVIKTENLYTFNGQFGFSLV